MKIYVLHNNTKLSFTELGYLNYLRDGVENKITELLNPKYESIAITMFPTRKKDKRIVIFSNAKPENYKAELSYFLNYNYPSGRTYGVVNSEQGFR